VEYLLRQDHEISVWIIISPVPKPISSTCGTIPAGDDPPRRVNPIMLEVDQVYHLACPASPVHYQYNPVKTIKTNVLGTLNMLGCQR